MSAAEAGAAKGMAKERERRGGGGGGGGGEIMHGASDATFLQRTANY